MMTVLPSSRIPDPYEAPPLRWGVIAPGGIAANMARALQRSTQRIVAVGSRTREHAEEFAATFGVERAYGSYEQLVSDPQVDAVYVASPHSAHRDHALLAIAAGKPVLVEKSFARNAVEAREVVEAARAAKVACVEAMWPRFAPRFDIVRQVLESGELGDIIAVDATHNRYIPAEKAPRLYDPERAGGAMLDLGIYPVSFVSFALGTPRKVLAAAEGRIELDGSMFFYSPGRVRLVRPDGSSIEAPEVGPTNHDALVYEASHLAHLVAEGATESPYLQLDETVSIMETMDEIRRQVGVAFPGE